MYVTKTDENCNAMEFSIVTTKAWTPDPTEVANMFVDEVYGVRTCYGYPETPADSSTFVCDPDDVPDEEDDKGNEGNCSSNTSKKGCMKKTLCEWDFTGGYCVEKSASGQKALNAEEATAAKQGMPNNSGNAKAVAAAWTVVSALMLWFQ